MMKWVFGILIIISVCFGFFDGKILDVSNAALDCGKDTIDLFLILIGSMAIWGGLMRIAEKSGLTDKIARLFRPIAKLLFKGLNPQGKAFKAITMNITANLLGLGNAATPLGLEAMHELEIEDKTTDTASRNMIMFTVMNTASMQLIPATIATLRLQYGSKDPLDILPGVLIVSAISLIIGILFVFIFDNSKKGGEHH